MLFKNALDIILRELPPKHVDLERPTEDTLVLIFRQAHQHIGKENNPLLVILLVLGVFIFFRGLIIGLELGLVEMDVTWDVFLSLAVGGGLCWWSAARLIKIDTTTVSKKRWLEFWLTEQGGELYENIIGREQTLLTQFDWKEITDILLERQKRIHEDKHPYCIHLQSNQYQDTYLFEWELLGKEVGYCANVLGALWQLQNKGTFPKDWNKPIEDNPPFTDLSKHLIDDE